MELVTIPGHKSSWYMKPKIENEGVAEGAADVARRRPKVNTQMLSTQYRLGYILAGEAVRVLQ